MPNYLGWNIPLLDQVLNWGLSSSANLLKSQMFLCTCGSFSEVLSLHQILKKFLKPDYLRITAS